MPCAHTKKKKQGSISALLLISTLTVASRCLIRFHLHKQRKRPRFLGLDDAFILAAYATSTAATALLLRQIDEAFFAEFVIGFAAHKAPDAIIVQLLADPAVSLDLVARLLRHHRVTAAVFVLAWWSVWLVKLSFLAFFRELLRRQAGRVMLCWLATLVFTVAATVFGFVVALVNCPHYGDWAKLGKKSRLPPKRFLTVTALGLGRAKAEY